MKTNVKDYCILKSLGAAGFHIKKLIGLQAVLLFILTVPLGLSIGIILSNDLLKVFHNVTYLEFSNHIPVTIILIFFLSGVISSTICIHGFIITVDLNQKRSSQISLD
jgi:predicted lysophospholipase L1 biosynthesis ABC-type transport system permease subunit